LPALHRDTLEPDAGCGTSAKALPLVSSDQQTSPSPQGTRSATNARWSHGLPGWSCERPRRESPSGSTKGLGRRSSGSLRLLPQSWSSSTSRIVGWDPRVTARKRERSDPASTGRRLGQALCRAKPGKRRRHRFGVQYLHHALCKVVPPRHLSGRQPHG
jgi:hypothetical protein